MPEGWSRYGNTVVGPPGDDWTYLRIVVEHLSGAEQREAGGDTERYTAYTSQDGRTWVRGGVWTHSLGDEQIGLVSMGATDQVTHPDHRRVRLRPRLLAEGRAARLVDAYAVTRGCGGLLAAGCWP